MRRRWRTWTRRPGAHAFRVAMRMQQAIRALGCPLRGRQPLRRRRRGRLPGRLPLSPARHPALRREIRSRSRPTGRKRRARSSTGSRPTFARHTRDFGHEDQAGAARGSRHRARALGDLLHRMARAAPPAEGLGRHRRRRRAAAARGRRRPARRGERRRGRLRARLAAKRAGRIPGRPVRAARVSAARDRPRAPCRRRGGARARVSRPHHRDAERVRRARTTPASVSTRSRSTSSSARRSCSDPRRHRRRPRHAARAVQRLLLRVSQLRLLRGDARGGAGRGGRDPRRRAGVRRRRERDDRRLRARAAQAGHARRPHRPLRTAGGEAERCGDRARHRGGRRSGRDGRDARHSLR